MVEKLTQKIGSDAEIVGKATVDEGLVVKENGNVVIDSDHDIADSGLKAVKIDKPTLVTDTLLVGNLDEDMEHGMQFAVTPQETLVGGNIRQPATDSNPTATFQNTTVANLTVNDLSEGLITSNNYGELSVDSTVDLTELHALEGIESNVQQQINDEVANRTSADNELQEKLATEKTERESADDSLSSRIDAEVNTRTSEVASLTEAIQTESDARLQEDTALNTKIDTEISEREEDVSNLNNAVAGLTTQLNEETTARTNKDSELQTAIENEASARASDVSGLRSDLTDETTARVQAVNGLTQSLNSEIADRQNADGVLQTAIENEVRDRTNEDASLDSRLDAIEERIVLPWEGQDTLAKTSDLNNAIGQVNIDLGKKVDKITEAHSNTVAYVQTSGKDETYIPISASDTPDAIALRNPNGTIEVPMPNMGGEATNKSYVDSEVKQTRDALQDHIDNRDNPHGVSKEQLGLQYVENYPMDSDPMHDSPNYVSSGGVYSAIDTVQGTIYAHTMDLDNPHHVTKEQLDLGNVVNRTMDSQPESGSMNYVESGGVYTAIQNVVGSLQAHENDTDNPHQVTKEQVGLGNVDNTSDADKPVSTAQQTAIDGVQSNLDDHESDTNNPHNVTKTQVGLGNVDNTSDMDKPVSTAQSVAIGNVQSELDTHEQTYATSTTYGHVKMDGTIGDGNRTDVTISEAGIKAYVNSSIGTSTADFLGTYNAVADLGFTQTVVDTWTDPPTSAVESTVGNAITTVLNAESITPTSNDYVFVSVNESITTDIDWFWRFKFDGSVWLYEYTLNNSSFTQAQWDSINSGITNTKVSNYDTHVSSRSNPHGVTKAQVGLGNVDNTSDLNKPISTATQTALDNKVGTVNQTGSGYVSAVAIDTTDKTKLNVTRTAIPNVAVTGGTAESGKYISAIATNGHGITVTKANLPTIPDITVADSGTGYVSSIAVDTTDKHKLNVTKTAIPSVGVTGGATESGKYVSAIATNGHGITVTKTALPSLSKGTTGSGNVVSDISVSGHTITLTKGITAITDISGKANTNLNNISGLDTDNAGKAILVSSTGGIEFGEAGKVDDVQLNGTSVVSNKIANLPAYPTVNNGTFNIQGNGTTAGSFTANATGTTNINLVGGGGTTVTADATNKKITISTTLPTVNNGTLTITQNGTSKGTFSANSSTSPTIALTDTWTPMTGATSSADGTVGYVNAIPPKDGYNTKYLRADGTWTVPPDHTYTVNNGTLTIKGGTTTATTFTANSSTSPTLTVKGSGATTVTGASGTITVSSTDQSVTAVGNHYVPSGGTTTSASGGADTNITNLASGSGVNVVTGVTLDDAGHVTGITSKALRSVNNTYTVNNGKLSLQGNGTEVASFTANQSSGSTFNLADGTGISLTNDTTNKKITVNGVAVSKTTAGLCPQLPNETTTTKFLRQDGSWQVPAYPTVNNGTLTIKGGSTSATTFTANSSTSPTLTISGSGGTTVTGASGTITVSSTAVGNGTLTIKQNSASKGTFTANATGNATIELTDTTYSAGDGLTLSGTEISETYPIYYAKPNETTSTATLTATISNFPSAYKDGIMIALRMPFNNVASSTLNVNGLGAKSVYYANNTTTATRWGPAGCIALLVYETTTTTNGCWKAVYSWESGNSGTWDTNTNDRFKYGEAVVAGSLVAVGTDGLTWKIRSGKELRMPLVGGRSTATYAVNGNYGALNWSVRGIALTELTNATMQGTAFTVPTWAIGNTIYLRGTIGSGGGFVADGTITNAITNPSSGTIAYVPIGFVEKTNNNNAVYMSLFMRDLDVFVIDTNGRVVSVNGKGIHASVSDSASSVAWGNVSSRPTKLSQFTNDVVNNATLTIQKNGTNVQTFTANQSTNATANITVPTKTSELTNDSGYITTWTTVNNGTLNIQGDANTVGSFTANATGTTNINFASGTGITLARDTTNKKITVNHSNSVTAQTTGVGSATAVPIIKYDAQGHITSVTTATIYPPTTAGTSGQLWKSDGSGQGGWVNQSSITSGACSGNSATATRMQYAQTVTNRTITLVSSTNTEVSGYPYKYSFAVTGATTNHCPSVTFSMTELGYNVWAPISSTGSNVVYIYAKSQQSTLTNRQIGYVLN